MRLNLTKAETQTLLDNGSVTIIRKPYEIVVEKREYYDGYSITIINPFTDVVLHKEDN